MGLIQSNVSHAVHRLRPFSTAISNGYVADHALDDIRRHVLRAVPWSRDQSHPESGLLAAAVSREGETSRGVHGV